MAMAAAVSWTFTTAARAARSRAARRRRWPRASSPRRHRPRDVLARGRRGDGHRGSSVRSWRPSGRHERHGDRVQLRREQHERDADARRAALALATTYTATITRRSTATDGTPLAAGGHVDVHHRVDRADGADRDRDDPGGRRDRRGHGPAGGGHVRPRARRRDGHRAELRAQATPAGTAAGGDGRLRRGRRTTARLTPTAALAAGMAYTAQLTTAIRATDGTPLAARRDAGRSRRPTARARLMGTHDAGARPA